MSERRWRLVTFLVCGFALVYFGAHVVAAVFGG